jgi:ABC-type branched-subunit amino acid transport system substrate-binding protein
MKKISSFLLLNLFLVQIICAQSIETGKSLYEQGDYKRAILVFENIETIESQLFLGKSCFAERNYLKSINILSTFDDESPLLFLHDALYTSSLAHFQLKNYAKSLELLHYVIKTPNSSSITQKAKTTYFDIIGFLTTKQLFDTFKSVSNDAIRLDILEYSTGIISYNAANSLLDLYETSALKSNDLQLNRIKTQLLDSLTYTSKIKSWRNHDAPSGISYNVGVVLPQFEYDTPEYEIPQHIYYGIQMAIENFNRENADQKAFITYHSTNKGFSSDAIMSDFVYNQGVDVVIGPLFSQVAKDFSNLAEDFQIPMVLPLANADSLDLFNNYVFQINPTFGAQGKIMANKAIELGYDTVGVIVEKQSLGAPAARAFRHEVERLGGFVEYYFEENFVELGYDIRDFTQFFTTDTLDSVAIVEAIYAPFTGTIAQTLIQSLLTDLEAMKSEVAILGSEEWRDVNIESRRLDSTQLYYSKSFDVDTSSTLARQFISEFRIRFQTDPNQFAFIGYDTAKLILDQLKRVKNPAYLIENLRRSKPFKGLSISINFDGKHENEAALVEKMIRENQQF